MIERKLREQDTALSTLQEHLHKAKERSDKMINTRQSMDRVKQEPKDADVKKKDHNKQKGVEFLRNARH